MFHEALDCFSACLSNANTRQPIADAIAERLMVSAKEVCVIALSLFITLFIRAVLIHLIFMLALRNFSYVNF